MPRRPRQSLITGPFGSRALFRRPAREGHLSDLYHWLLTTRLGVFAAAILGGYLGTNGLFAIGYLYCGGIDNMRPGSFADAFFFSVQTMATIGYGRMVPVGFAANALVTAEAGVGLFGIALAASLMFARFTRPTAGVRFSRNAVVNLFDRKPTLMFRMANQRRTRIHEAQVYVVLVRDQFTAEGQRYRRLLDLTLVRSFTPVFELSWTVMHVIDESSPLHGCSKDVLADSQTAFTVVFSGHQEGFGQAVHARHTYEHGQIAWNHRFADLFRQGPDGRRIIDHTRFDDLVEEPAAVAER
jgi:inward rectifier potassium channel